MSIYKRGDVYWYKFMWKGQLVRESTKQGNDKVARQMEAAHRTSLAKGEVGIRERKPAPTLGTFRQVSIPALGRGNVRGKAWKTWLWYRNGARRLLACRGRSQKCNLDKISGRAHRGIWWQRRAVARDDWFRASTGELEVCGRMLRLALEWGTVERVAKVRIDEERRTAPRSLCSRLRKRRGTSAAAPNRSARLQPFWPTLAFARKSATA